MRNTINTDGNISGSDVASYLDRAAELNDEVDTVPFGLETSDNEIVKVYVNAEQADAFEDKMKQLLGAEKDIEEALNELAMDFDIVDVVWPEDKTEAAENEAPIGDPSHDDFDDLDNDGEMDTIAEYDDLTESLDPDAVVSTEATEAERATWSRLEAVVGQLHALGTGGVRVVTGLTEGKFTKTELIRKYIAEKYAADCATAISVLKRAGVSREDYPYWLAEQA
jgi:hypothetical protein